MLSISEKITTQESVSGFAVERPALFPVLETVDGSMHPSEPPSLPFNLAILKLEPLNPESEWLRAQ